MFVLQRFWSNWSEWNLTISIFQNGLSLVQNAVNVDSHWVSQCSVEFRTSIWYIKLDFIYSKYLTLLTQSFCFLTTSNVVVTESLLENNSGNSFESLYVFNIYKTKFLEKYSQCRFLANSYWLVFWYGICCKVYLHIMIMGNPQVSRDGPAAWSHSDVMMLLFFAWVLSDSLRPHGLQHTRLPCPSPSPGICSYSCSLSPWCHPTISSSVPTFSSCPQSLPASGFCFVFLNELAFCIRWIKCGSFSFSMSPSDKHSWLISFRVDWFDLAYW